MSEKMKPFLLIYKHLKTTIEFNPNLIFPNSFKLKTLINLPQFNFYGLKFDLMSVVTNNEERAVYCKYCGKLCIKLVSTTKENSGRMFLSNRTPRVVGGHGWMEWVDRIGYFHSLGRFEALELVLKEKNDQIAQLELENEHISKDLGCLRELCDDV
ncbi:hypothetical protein Leryth_009672 [Lithospermum erythrorhizon]|nr:hypothetical protein Leryth_009672 [Lithospermum erythrorhizon]